MFSFTQLDVTSGYASGVLRGLVVMGVGVGFVFGAGLSTATLGIGSADAGVGSAIVNTTQQVGGSIGTALLSTLFASAVTSYAASNADNRPRGAVAAVSAVHGYTTVFAWAAAILTVGAILCAFLIRPGRHAHDPNSVPALPHEPRPVLPVEVVMTPCLPPPTIPSRRPGPWRKRRPGRPQRWKLRGASDGWPTCCPSARSSLWRSTSLGTGDRGA